MDISVQLILHLFQYLTISGKQGFELSRKYILSATQSTNKIIYNLKDF